MAVWENVRTVIDGAAADSRRAGTSRIASAALLAAALAAAPAPAGAGAPVQPALQDNFPKPVHYRYANNFKVKPGLENEAVQLWLSRYGGVMGVELDAGRVILTGDGRPEVIRRVMKERPDLFFILYSTGHIKCPDETSPYFDPVTGNITDWHPGHWCYLPRVKVLQDSIPRETGETTIKVDMSPPRLGPREGMDDEDFASTFTSDAFSLRKDRGDDICIYSLLPDGTPDWENSEQVALVAMDKGAGTVRVRRGCYGSSPKAFQGTIFAAVHDEVTKFHGWLYNFSTFCPRDAKGRTAGDLWAETYAAIFQPGGLASHFHAIQHDTLVETLWGKRGIDNNNNGTDDMLEDLGGVNWFAVGMTDALRKLREALPPHVSILPDAGNRGYYYVNGWEVEGFPGRHDPAWRGHSEICNRLAFSRETCLTPRFTQVQHKIFNFTLGSDEPGAILQGRELPFHYSRAVLALATAHEAGVTWYSLPPPDEGGETGVYDEMRMGKELRPGWLGKPVGDLLYPAVQAQPPLVDLLAGGTDPVPLDGTVLARDKGLLKLTHPDKARPIRMAWKLESPSADLTVLARLRGVRREGVPVKMPREMRVSLVGGTAFPGYLIPDDPSPLRCGIVLKSGDVKMLSTPVEAETGFTLGLHSLQVWHKDPEMARLFWEAQLCTPDNARLHFWVFNVNAPCAVEAAAVGADGQPGAFQQIASIARVQGPAPLLRNIDLAPLGLAGKDVVFRFLSAARTHGSANGSWGEVTVAAGDRGGNVPAGLSQAKLGGVFGGGIPCATFPFPPHAGWHPAHAGVRIRGGRRGRPRNPGHPRRPGGPGA